ncbi:uncharacterized protein [Diadema setosum]|uniref:uncharacterized protein n=1 Tax=Diadema setosum TaxID=31175 RepID=UPI003B3A5413
MDRRLAIGAATLTWLASMWRQGDAQFCQATAPATGTRFNGTIDNYYQPGDVLTYSCDVGYRLNYANPISTCIQTPSNPNTASWQPSDIKCNLDVVSLAVACIVALVGLFVFTVAIMWLVKRRKETDSRKIKRKARENTYVTNHFEQRRSTRNGHVNQGMTDIEMTPVNGNGSVINREGNNGHANGFVWSPPKLKGSVKQESEVAILSRSRKASSGTSRSSRSDNVNANVASGVQLNPDVGDIEFGASNTNFTNIKDIGSSVKSMAHPSMGTNKMDMSLPMPESASPTLSNDANASPETARDYGDLYASVDMSKKSKKKKEEQKENNNNSNVNSIVTVATIESDGGYSAVGSFSSPSGSFSAHEEALADDSAYSAIKLGDDSIGEDDYATVERKEVDDETPRENEDFGDLYAKVKR